MWFLQYLLFEFQKITMLDKLKKADDMLNHLPFIKPAAVIFSIMSRYDIHYYK